MPTVAIVVVLEPEPVGHGNARCKLASKKALPFSIISITFFGRFVELL